MAVTPLGAEGPPSRWAPPRGGRRPRAPHPQTPCGGDSGGDGCKPAIAEPGRRLSTFRPALAFDSKGENLSVSRFKLYCHPLLHLNLTVNALGLQLLILKDGVAFVFRVIFFC